MPNNITIPLNSPVDFASYEKVTSPNNEVSFSKKESMYYRNCLSNIRKTEQNGFTTTNGKLISTKENEAYYNGVSLGLDLSKGIFVTNKKELPTNYPAKLLAVTTTKDAEALIIFSKSDNQGYITYYDKNLKLINTNTYSLLEGEDTHKLVLPIRRIDGNSNYEYTPVESDTLTYANFNTLESPLDYFIQIEWKDNTSIAISPISPVKTTEGNYKEVSIGGKVSFTFPKIKHENIYETQPLYTYLGEKIEVVSFQRLNKGEKLAIAIDDTDQRKRVTFTIESAITENKVSLRFRKDLPYFGTFGLYDNAPFLFGEPLPINDIDPENPVRIRGWIPYSTKVWYPFLFEKNGVISWIIDTTAPEIDYANDGPRFFVHEKSKNYYSENAPWKKSFDDGHFKRRQIYVYFCSSIRLVDEALDTNTAFSSQHEWPNIDNMWHKDRPRSLYVVSTPYPYDLGDCKDHFDTQEDEIKTCNPFPTGTVYSNITENRGKYWDYGEGWTRSLNFTWALWRGKTNDNFDIIQTPLLLFTKAHTYEVADALGGTRNLKLVTDLPEDASGECKWQVTGYDGNGATFQQLIFADGANAAIEKNNLQMPTLSNILGGTNTEGWIMELPFDSETSVKNIKSQWYKGLKVAHTFSNNNKVSTTLSTPGDELERPLSVIHYKKETNELVVLDGSLIYTISPANSDPSKHLSIEKVSDYMFKLNILNLPNLILEHSDGSFSLVSSFDGYAMPTKINIEEYTLKLPPVGSDTNNMFIFASGYNQEKFAGNPSASFLFPYAQVPFYLDSTDSLYFNKICKDIKSPIIDVDTDSYPTQRDDRPIDVYYSHLGIGTIPEYQYTLKDGGRKENDIVKVYDIDKAGFVWETTAEEMYFPIGICSILKSQNYITPTVQLSSDYSIRLLNRNNQTYMIFNNSARTYKGQVIFTIYGGNYTYDGQGIYYIGSGNDYSQSQFVCYALGLKFLANSGSEAYFYSPWEKRLFIFTGSNTLQADESYSSLGDVVDSLFSSNEQTLYLLFDTEEKDRRVLVGKTPNDTSTLSVAPDSKLATSSKGVIVYNDVEYLADQTSQTLSPSVGDLVPFKIETEYIGDPATLYKFSYIDLLFYGIKKDISFTVTYDVINGITKTTETKEINLKAADWKAESYRYTFTPTHMMGNSCRIGIKSDDELYLSYIGIGIDEASTNPTAPRTKGK